MQNKQNLVWMDLEMTGLLPDKDTIIEIATIITDSHLNVIKEGPCLVVHQSQARMEKMDEWNTQHHGESGLTQRVLKSKLTMRDVEDITLKFIQQYVPAQTSPLCGNSICQDRQFIYRYMPKIDQYLHYRHIDVSTLKELSYRWTNNRLKKFEKSNKHRALDDIYESIAELRHYRTYLFKDFSSIT